MSEPRVTLFKADGDTYTNHLIGNGYPECGAIPVLSFTYVNAAKLWSALMSCRSYSGLIITSPRVAMALHLVINANDVNKEVWRSKLLSDWNRKRLFVVGKATHKAVTELGLLNISGAETGSASAMARYIIAFDYPESKFLVPCGNLSSDEYLTTLVNEGFSYEKLIVYETIENECLKSSIARRFLSSMTDDNREEILVFFSPSGLAYSLPHLNEFQIDLASMKLVAIGPTTAEEMKCLGVHCSAYPLSPTPKSLCDAINSIT